MENTYSIHSKEEQEFLNSVNNKIYDIDSLQIDIQTNNFDVTDPDVLQHLQEYNKETLIVNSIHNGQRKQARQLCERFGLDYGTIIENNFI